MVQSWISAPLNRKKRLILVSHVTAIVAGLQISWDFSFVTMIFLFKILVRKVFLFSKLDYIPRVNHLFIRNNPTYGVIDDIFADKIFIKMKI